MPYKTVPTLRGAGITPACPHCGHNEHVIRVWFGGVKQWACSVHYRVKSTETVPQSFKDRLLHRDPESKDFGIAEIFPNRKARRAR